jgi:uncharacterized protein (DUF1800 family)
VTILPPQLNGYFFLRLKYFIILSVLLSVPHVCQAAQPQRRVVRVQEQRCLRLRGKFVAVVQPSRSKSFITNRQAITELRNKLNGARKGARIQILKSRIQQLRAGVSKCRIANSGGTNDPRFIGAEFSGDHSSLQPYRNSLTEREVVHLCRKVALGCSPELIEFGVSRGLEQLVEHLLRESTPRQVDSFANRHAVLPNGTWNQQSALQYWTILLAGGSPLHERMALFWHDHFATSLVDFGNKRDVAYIPWHLNLLRGEALGSFENLLTGMHSDPAMLEWLDNRFNYFDPTSSALHINENYAREVLELFTMGVLDFYTGSPNYTETDMRMLARALTGWDIVFRDGLWVSRFQTARWDPGEKDLFSSTYFRSSSRYNYQTATEYLLYHHPSTSRNIAGKLLRVFVQPDPPESITQELADQLIATRYDIRAAMRSLMMSSAIFSPESRKVCILSPSLHLLSSLRALGIQVKDDGTLWAVTEFMREAGEELLNPPTVFGWMGCGVGQRGTSRSQGEIWLSAHNLVSRQRWFTEVLHQIFWSDKGRRLLKLLPSPQASAEETLDFFSIRLDVPLSSEEKALIIDNFLTKEIGADGQKRVSPWDTTNKRLTHSRIAGILEILFLHPRGMLN